jgi:glucokinase
LITLAADVGGTRVKLGLVNDMNIVARATIEARSSEGLAQLLPRVAEEFKRLLDGAGLGFGACEVFSVGFPSIVDAASGRIKATYGKYMDALEIDLAAWTKEVFGLKFCIENDARVALLGEWGRGAGMGCNNLVAVTLGTGLGTAALIDGNLLRGPHGQAGILGGHVTVRFGGRLCSCGNRGCAEAEASTAVLEAIVREQPEYVGSRLSEVSRIDYAALFRLARAGDVCAAKVRERTIEVWAAMIVNLIHAYDPERVVVGGGILDGANDFLPDLVAKISGLAHTPWGKVDIRPALLGDDAALIGCDLLARRRMFSNE